MIKKIKIIAFIYFSLITSFSFGQNWIWAFSGGNTLTEEAKSISTDLNGNAFVAGVFKDSIFNGNNKLYSHGNDDIFIAKFDNSGNLLWTRCFGGSQNDGYGVCLKTDLYGNCYVTGAYSYTAHIGSLTLSNGYSNNVFLLKFNSIGNIIFAKDYLSSGSSVGYGIDIDFAQNCYITGYFYNELFAIPNNVQSVGSHDIFIAKTDIQGNIIWSRSAGGNSYDTGGGVSIDINGNVYITGYFNNASQFGSMVVNSSGGDDIFVAKYSNTGNLIWVSRTYGAGVYDLGLKIRTFNDKVYLVGQFEDVITIGSQIFSSFGLSDGFVSMLDSSGSFLWTKQLGGQGSDRLTDLNVVNNNNVFIAGWCNGIAVFDNVIVSTGNNQNGIICLLDASGNLVNYKLASGNGNNLFNSIAVQQLGEVFVAGAVADTLFLDNLMIHSNGASDALIAKVIFEVNSSNEISLEGLKVLNNIFTNESSPFLVSSVMQNLHTLEIMDVKGSVLQKLPATILYPNEKFIIKNTFLKNLSLGVYYLKIVLKDSNKTQYFKIIKV